MILILDYGSQYTQLIARRMRELGYYSQVYPGDLTVSEIKKLEPTAIILSGGPASVHEKDAPSLPSGFDDYLQESHLPVLGICYGMQLLAQELGGKVEQAAVKEYGRMGIHFENSISLPSQPSISNLKVWMSHGDEVKVLPVGFHVLARSENGVLAAMENQSRKILAFQFHPEVTHSDRGMDLFRYFLETLSGLSPNWTMGSVIDREFQKISDQVGPDEHAICALSGGVDSTVAAVLVSRVLGPRLHCVFVDHGLLRFEERNRMMKLFQDELNLNVIAVDASDRFLGRLSGVNDPEAKRKIIGAEFISVFQEQAKIIEQEIGQKPAFLVQGTLYPDVIESSVQHGVESNAPVSALRKKLSATIKSHHNVGGLPEKLGFALIEPFRDLFKDEVRKLGEELGVPSSFIGRHPFPGPGLAVRVLGDLNRTRIKTLQLADEIFISELRSSGLYDQIWQAFAVLLPVKSVAVKGDGRAYEEVVALRAVTSVDGMTADWFHFPFEFLSRVSNRICNEVPGVSRVVLDISSKPPATIEWE